MPLPPAAVLARFCGGMSRDAALCAANEPLFPQQFVGTFMGAAALIGVAGEAMSNYSVSASLLDCQTPFALAIYQTLLRIAY